MEICGAAFRLGVADGEHGGHVFREGEANLDHAPSISVVGPEPGAIARVPSIVAPVRTLLLCILISSLAFAQGRGRRGGPPPGTDLFVPFDTNRDGVLSTAEFRAAFRFLDADESGKVERSELAGPAGAAFGVLDRDGDGVLDRTELQRAAQRMAKIPQPTANLPDPYGALPPLQVPKANPLTKEKAVLGKMLFWEQQISSTKTVSCGTCHSPRHGGADARIARHPGPDGAPNTPDDVFGSPGVASLDRRQQPLGQGVQVTPRSSPAFFGTLHAPELFWDGRARGKFRDPLGGGVQHRLRRRPRVAGASQPILNRVEMSHEGRTWTPGDDGRS